MILYNVTINIDNTVAEDWLTWMKEVHIPEVMATTYFIKYQICKMLTEYEDNGGTTYAVQYFARHLADLEEYQRDFEADLQKKHHARYPNKYVTFHSILEVME